MKTKELGWKETQGIQTIGIEDFQANRKVEQSQVLKIWDNYMTELRDRTNWLETLEVEPEKEVDKEEKGPYILESEVEKTIKEMRNKKATDDDDVPGDVFTLLGEGGLKIMTKLINTIYETGLHGSYNDCLKEETTSYKMQRPSHNQPYRTYSEDSSKDT